MNNTNKTQNEDLFTGLAVLALLGAITVGAVGAAESRFYAETGTTSSIEYVK